MKNTKAFLFLPLILILLSCSKDNTIQDPIVGTYYFSGGVEYKHDSTQLVVRTSELSGGELEFKNNGEFSFTHWKDGFQQTPYYYTTSGHWYKLFGEYRVDFDSEFFPYSQDTCVYKNQPKVIFDNYNSTKIVKIQSDDKIVNGVVQEYFRREYYK